ncbi:MAG: alpha-glucan family phosphorylase, partial [Kiritimatiellaeota bacterium]|nr:alpha-glucan family phosphorylase [Kiritimatiellota bacterium]
LVRQIAEFVRDPDIAQHVVFLENYNMHIARRLVRGVDVWLNTPRRPNEASGTSGMKACINGAIHVSTLDGWWPEGYTKETGWAIGDGEEFADWQAQDHADAQTLYNLLESEIVPAFYDRPNGELPVRWIRMMRESVKMSLVRFSSTRMVAEYYDTSYTPALASSERLAADNYKLLREETAAHNRIKAEWDGVDVSFPDSGAIPGKLLVGDEIPVSVRVNLGGISPDDVEVEFYVGTIGTDGVVSAGETTRMERVKDFGDGWYEYGCVGCCRHTGAYGYSARIRPTSAALRDTMPGYVKWAR